MSSNYDERLTCADCQSECPTTDLITELSREVKAMPRGRKRRREDTAGEDPPKSA